jgi:2-methylcitrate synthase
MTTTMTEAPAAAAATAFKPKKSVALSGVTAGNTALCTVGRSGNDLHYRGYDILDIAEVCEFEEIAHLLVHGKLPTRAELRAYKTRLKALRGLPSSVKLALEQLPAGAHPMDVMRTGVSALGCVLPEKEDHNLAGSRDIADRLMASLGSMLLYWYHWSNSGRRIEVETDDDSIGGHFLHLLHGQRPSDAWVRAMHTSLNLYAEHEFNASTFTARVIAGTGSDMYSSISGAIGALRGPSMAAPTRWPSRSRSATTAPTRPRPTSAAVSRPRRSSSASATRSTPSATRATWSSRAWPSACPTKRDRPRCTTSPTGWRP